MRHMYEYGTKPEQVAMVKVVHSEHASNNPKAYYKKRYTVDDVAEQPDHLQTVASARLLRGNRQCHRDHRHQRGAGARPAPHPGADPRHRRSLQQAADGHALSAGPISRVAGYYAKDILWPNAGVGPEDIDAAGAYDAFTFTSMLQLEDYGFCKKGEGGEYVSSGVTRLGGKRRNNTSGGHLCEGYTHGMNMVIENVRQLAPRRR